MNEETNDHLMINLIIQSINRLNNYLIITLKGWTIILLREEGGGGRGGLAITKKHSCPAKVKKKSCSMSQRKKKFQTGETNYCTTCRWKQILA